MISIQMSRRKPESLRQELDQLLGELGRLARTFTSRSPLWEGNVYLLRRRCGRPNCHCAEGDLHTTPVLSDRTGASPRTVTLKGKDVERFRQMTESYRRFREARAQVTKITKRILHIVDQLGNIRLKQGLKHRKRE